MGTSERKEMTLEQLQEQETLLLNVWAKAEGLLKGKKGLPKEDLANLLYEHWHGEGAGGDTGEEESGGKTDPLQNKDKGGKKTIKIGGKKAIKKPGGKKVEEEEEEEEKPAGKKTIKIGGKKPIKKPGGKKTALKKPEVKETPKDEPTTDTGKGEDLGTALEFALKPVSVALDGLTDVVGEGDTKILAAVAEVKQTVEAFMKASNDAITEIHNAVAWDTEALDAIAQAVLSDEDYAKLTEE